MSSSVRAPRPRNSANTRAAILAAASRQFANEGYDHVGVRQIAAEVGVDPALVYRYFGSKEDLFREVLETLQRRELLMSSLEGIARELAVNAVDGTSEDERLRGLLLVLRSLSSPTASGIVKQVFASDVIGPLAGSLRGADVQFRAAMAAAVILGVTLVSTLIGSTALTNDEPAKLEERIRAVLATAAG